MDKDYLDILLLEDNPIDAKVITGFIKNAGIPGKFKEVKTKVQFEKAIQEKDYDIILSDHQLEDFYSIEALEIRNQTKPGIPFILITSTISETFALEIIKHGATDYIFKTNLQRLPLAINHAIESRKMEQAFQIVKDRFELATRATVHVIWDYDIINNSIYLSEAARSLFKINIKESDPAALIRFVYPGDKIRVVKSFWSTVQGSDNKWKEVFRIFTPETNTRHINASGIIMRKNGQAVRAIGVFQDITEFTVLQNRLLMEQLDKQKQISQMAIKAQEKEREEIGKELHDNVNQLLAVAKVLLDAAKSSPANADDFMTRSQESIMQAINEIRNISHAMIPPSFDEIDFTESLADLVNKINISKKFDIELLLPEESHMQRVEEEIKLAIYRIVQEQLSNILKYSIATQIKLRLELKKNVINLTLEDNGIGFDPEVKKKGIGLKNIEKRAEYFQGRMLVVTAPGEGCTLKVQIPLNEHQIVDKVEPGRWLNE